LRVRGAARQHQRGNSQQPLHQDLRHVRC
jgi:hypothetical protein